MQTLYDSFMGFITGWAVYGWLDRLDSAPLDRGEATALTGMAAVLIFVRFFVKRRA